MKPSTIIAILSLKLYLSHKRKEDRIRNIILINKINTSFQYGYNKEILKTPRSDKPKNDIWSKSIAEMIEERKISFENSEEN